MKRWLGIGPQSTGDGSVQLAEAYRQHISDLRVLLDKSDEREAQLLEMVKAANDAHYYRPVVSGAPAENKVKSAIPVEHLSDVETFDEKSDTEQIAEQDRRAQELRSEFELLVKEQNEEGLHRVQA